MSQIQGERDVLPVAGRSNEMDLSKDSGTATRHKKNRCGKVEAPEASSRTWPSQTVGT